MSDIRIVNTVLRSKTTMEGAGVKLQRAFGYNEVPQLDPFLLLDHFGSDNPDDYMAGFPWHPHRGIETVTYMIEGKVEHGDSIGNSGIISSGDVQWMTAGGGIVHQEMPKRIDGHMQGFQLWVNLPAKMKMMPPRYQEVKASEIPEVQLDSGGSGNEKVRVKVICGTVGNVTGPVKDIVVDPEYLDVTIPAEGIFEHDVKDGYRVFAYVMEGSGVFDRDGGTEVGKGNLVIYGDKGKVKVQASGEGNGGISGNDESGIRFILVSGKPIREPVAWYGPIVMNTQEELEIAFREYREGTFTKS